MFLHIELGELPPVLSVGDPENLSVFEVRMRVPEETTVTKDGVLSLIPEHIATHEWQEQFSAMLEVASRHGWVLDDGRIVAHVVCE